MTRKQIQKIFQDFSKLKVLVIGDVMIDSYMWGKVNRISPEAPVPVVLVQEKENRLGGAANVALNIQSLGATPVLCSVVGADENGNVFLDLLKEQKLTAKGIMKCRGRTTTTKTRVISANHQMLRVDEEMEDDISEQETQQLISRITHLIKNEQADVVIFEDYDKGLITPLLIKKVVEQAEKKGVPTVVDPKKKNFLFYKGVSLFKPNLKELKEGVKKDFDVNNTRQFLRLSEAFRKKQRIDHLLVTLSEKGVLINTSEEKKILPAHIRNVADVSGAGDTVVSVAALCLALGLSPVDIATISNLAGGIVCEKVGVVPVDKEQLLAETQMLYNGRFRNSV